MKFSSVINRAHIVAEEELGLMLPYYLKKIRKAFLKTWKVVCTFQRCVNWKPDGIEDGLSKSDKKTTEEKKRSNKLCLGKLIKAVQFLAANNLPVKELYPKLVSFLADDIEEPVVKQYWDTCQKNQTYQSSDSCDSFLLSLNTHFKELVNERACHAQDIVLFADEVTSASRKEMIGIYVSSFDENSKLFCLHFLTLQSISSSKSKVIIDKIKEVLSERGIDISRTRFVYFDGTNTMSGEQNRGSIKISMWSSILDM